MLKSISLIRRQNSDGAGAAAGSPPEDVSHRVLAAAIAANALEFFDFVAWSFYAVYIAAAYFPAESEALSLLLSVAVFGVGFLARPVGAIVLGLYADRKGRRPAMLASMALITLGTAVVALTPGYASWGLFAPIAVVVARLVQGFAIGGDVGAATAFLVEVAPRTRRGLYSSWQLGSQGLAAMVAGLLGLTLTSTLSMQEMQAWGWRVPFLLSLLMIPLAIYLRRHMPETSTATVTSRLTVVASRQTSRVVGLAVLILAGATISTYVSSYMTTFAVSALKLPAPVSMGATIVVGLFLFFGAIAGGWLSDRYGPLWPAVTSRLVLCILAVPLFSWLVDAPSLMRLLAAAAFMSVLTTLSGVPALLAIAAALPSAHRARGIAIGYALATSIFGGTTQVLVTWLMHASGSALVPAWYVSLSSLLMCVALMFLVRKSARASMD